jgi:hypothetical protein
MSNRGGAGMTGARRLVAAMHRSITYVARCSPCSSKGVIDVLNTKIANRDSSEQVRYYAARTARAATHQGDRDTSRGRHLCFREYANVISLYTSCSTGAVWLASESVHKHTALT